MTERERFLETVLFGSADRVPLEPGHGRRSTREAWYVQGLPTEVSDTNHYAYQQAGGTLAWPRGGPGFDVNERMIPQFEELVLERRERSQIVQDWKGNICEISSEHRVEYLRNPVDFVTRRWIRCPVETRADWAKMQARYDPEDPSRFPEDTAALGKQLAGRDWVVEVSLAGPFWQVREWVGFERLCTLFYDDPQWVGEMIGFWGEFVLNLLTKLFGFVTPDVVHLSEDMAFKEHAMISPAMARKYLLPIYRRWGEAVRGAGCRVYAMDSDGYVGELIPVWIEGGINVCDPMEVAAGNDLVAFRREFGRDMAFRGGVDKRAIAKGGTAIETEIARIAPIIRDGGYIPGCDHGVPADVSWPNYVRYVGLLARETGWL
jgi:uroporphyrinogen decarboxylase